MPKNKRRDEGAENVQPKVVVVGGAATPYDPNKIRHTLVGNNRALALFSLAIKIGVRLGATAEASRRRWCTQCCSLWRRSQAPVGVGVGVLAMIWVIIPLLLPTDRPPRWLS